MELRWDCENIPASAPELQTTPLPPLPLRLVGRAGSLPPAAVAVAVSSTRGGEPCRLPLRSRWDELLAPATREGGSEEHRATGSGGGLAAAVPLAAVPLRRELAGGGAAAAFAPAAPPPSTATLAHALETAASPALAAPLLPALASTLARTLASDGAAALAAAPSSAAPGRAKRAT